MRLVGQIHKFRDRDTGIFVSHWFCHLEGLKDKFSLHDPRNRVSIVQEAAIFKMAAATILDFFKNPQEVFLIWAQPGRFKS